MIMISVYSVFLLRCYYSWGRSKDLLVSYRYELVSGTRFVLDALSLLNGAALLAEALW